MWRRVEEERVRVFDKIDSVLGINRTTVLLDKEVDDVEPDLLWRAALASLLRTKYNHLAVATESARRAERMLFGETHDVCGPECKDNSLALLRFFREPAPMRFFDKH